MMYIHDNNETDKRINASKIANNISTMGDNSTAAGCNSRLITVLVQHAHGIVSVTYYLLNDHSMMDSESEDISSNYLTDYTNFTNNLLLQVPFLHF